MMIQMFVIILRIPFSIGMIFRSRKEATHVNTKTRETKAARRIAWGIDFETPYARYEKKVIAIRVMMPLQQSKSSKRFSGGRQKEVKAARRPT